jgi:hypothetical protein
MPNFQGQRKIGKHTEEIDQIIEVNGGSSKRPRELDKNGRKSVMSLERFNAHLKLIHFFLGEFLPLVGEDLMEFDCEDKVRVVFNPPYPGPGYSQGWRSIKCAVNLHDIYVLCQKNQRMKICAFFCRIDNPFPVFVAPARRANVVFGHK